MKEIFLHIAPYITILFIVAMPPEVVRNIRRKTYASGTVSSWTMRIIGYGVFGIYSLMIGQHVVGIIQFIALAFSVIILSQRFAYRNAK